MKQFIYCSVFCIVTTVNIYSQNSLDDLNIIFKHDYENNTLGDYRESEWRRDFNDPEWANRQSTLDIVQDVSNNVNNTKTMQINFPANSLSPEQGGTQWWTLFEGQDEVYMSYDFQFMPGFNYAIGGKLPSFQAGIVKGDQPTGYDGFTGGLMFNKEGNLVFYIFYVDQITIGYGESFLWGTSGYKENYFYPSKVKYEWGSGKISYTDPGKWHNITYRMVANTINSDGYGNYDGIIEAFYDGVLVSQITHFQFRHTADLKIDRIRMTSFFGGSNDEWRNPIEEWLRVDNIMMFTFKDGFNVPRGNVLSPTNRTISYWRKILYDNSITPVAPSNIFSTNITKNSATIKWSDNSNNEYGFDVYRSNSATENFTKIGSTPSNVVEYTNTSLIPNTTYYYKVLAFSGNKTSGFSPVFSLTTKSLQIPIAPSGMKSVNPDISNIPIEWTDNSNNEFGFELEKSESDSEHFKLLTKIPIDQKTFIDKNITTPKNYYRIRSYNDDGFSGYSDTLLVEFIINNLPDAPSQLNIISVGYDKTTLKWKDNSVNENGFEIERRGPNNASIVNYFSVNINDTIFTDTRLSMNSDYTYYIRSFNSSGYSGYSNKVNIKTLNLYPPVAPTDLKTVDATQTYITIEWEDNSNNEVAYYVKRSLASDTNSYKLITLDANSIKYTDSEVTPSTNYIYSVFASNKAGNSRMSNIAVAYTLSVSIEKRIKDGLIAYYNFSYDPNFTIHDISGNQDPLDLVAQNSSYIKWHGNNSIELSSGANLISSTVASKIIKSFKKSNEIGIECWVKPSEPDSYSDSRIISISDIYDNLGFSLTQSYTYSDNKHVFNYGIRLQTASTSENGYPEFTLNQDINYINLLHLVYTKDSLCNEKLYLNGVLSSENYRSGGLNTWSDNYYICLGGSPDYSNPWSGNFYTVAFYNKALTDSQILENYSAGPSDNLVIYKNDYEIQISPNPVFEFATIEITPVEIQDIAPEAIFRIIDVYGTKYYEEILFNPGDKFTRNMDFRNYSKGIYVIQLISDSKQQSTKFIIE